MFIQAKRAVAQLFLGSEQFAERYGKNAANEKYVETLYINVLGRNSDIEKYNYWVESINNGIEIRHEALFTEMTGFA